VERGERRGSKEERMEGKEREEEKRRW